MVQALDHASASKQKRIEKEISYRILYKKEEFLLRCNVIIYIIYI